MRLIHAIYSGVAAGIAATAAQIVLWWVFWDALPEILYRDARLVAAIVLGPSVLPPPATFAWQVMLVAAVIHFALAVAYSVVLAALIDRCAMPASLLAGMLFGLALFAINMYGFTLVFPWFAQVRDWITLVTHAVFGVFAAGGYKVMSRC